LQPPLARISASVRCVSVPLGFCSSISSLLSSDFTGHCLQHALLSGRKASSSLQVKGGHCTRGHCTSRVSAYYKKLKLITYNHISFTVVQKTLFYNKGKHADHIRGQSSWLQIQRSRVQLPALPDFLRFSGTGCTQPHEHK
jgi:hypothetical protein